MSLTQDLIFLILQFCNEEKLKKTALMLQQETGYYFDLEYFGDLVLDGKWGEAEKYLSSFTVVEDNKYSTKIFFEIRKQKFLEALDKHEHYLALDILLNDLKVFAQSNKELYKEMTQLLASDDFREHNSLAFYGDTLSSRERIKNELRAVIEANPLLRGRTKFPQISKSRLRRLINQSLNWQHLQCAYPHPQPHIDTLFTDHQCPGPDDIQDQVSTPATSSINKELSNSNQSDSSSKVVVSKLSPDAAISESVQNPHQVKQQAAYPSRQKLDWENEFPRTLEQILSMSSPPTCMDFHPVHQTLLLVGKSEGGIEIWDVTSAEQLFNREFMVWDVKSVLAALWVDMKENPGISVNRVLWHGDGSLFGVAYSKRLIHLYSHHEIGDCFDRQVEIDAHIGSVNDIAFSKPHDRVVIISCGDDKLIQVWDAETGANVYAFEGHSSPVYSLCPLVKDHIHFLYSTSTRGEIKAWVLDNSGSKINYEYDAPGSCCTRMACSSDSRRLFSCGTNEKGESYIVEWNEGKGFIARNYSGLSKCSSSVVQIDTNKNQFLAAGDDHLIKIWDMDDEEILTAIDANGGLPVNPCIRFNKDGTLLAVSAHNNQIKILAVCELQKTRAGDCLPESCRELSVNRNPALKDVIKGVTDSANSFKFQVLDTLENLTPNEFPESNKMEISELSKVVEISRCQFVLLSSSDVETNMVDDGPSTIRYGQIRRLEYTHAGNGILALSEDGIHQFWRWLKCKSNSSARGTTTCDPKLLKPKSGVLMVNDLPDSSSRSTVTPCFAISKNEAYVVSASGNMISLYNILAFKKIRSLMSPPPSATCVVFYPPDNNVIAVGMDDSTILIYNIRYDKVISKLAGHSQRITGLVFSTNFNLLVSSGVDTKIVLWDTSTWEKKKSTVLEISLGLLSSDASKINIELDCNDQKHLLAVHETQLAVYETATLRRVKQWGIANFCTRILHATFSCDSTLVYAVMRDGILLVLDALDLAPRFEIAPSAFLPPHFSLGGYVIPMVVAAHPQKHYQLALGLSNGRVVVVEPFYYLR